MKKKALYTLFSLFILLLVACGTGDTNNNTTLGSLPTQGDINERANHEEDMNEDTTNGEGVISSMRYEDILFELSADVTSNSISVHMNLTNEADKKRQLDFSSGQKYDVIIKGEDGKILYHYAEGKMFTMMLEMKEINPGETLSYEDVWTFDDLSNYDELLIEGTIVTYALDGEEIDKSTFQQTIAVSL
ncbi:BsuPI-related putative proteinase inhibitor [Evansella sp. AB-P1]|uniref:BsuPI-related putative proteinase inhibitor n=1 Tax=Evansella sp. AB-P1 TaxID=3037653 RepID=UPI00241D9B19|nr:BsuPI-related putative proteinase inhibitor [Evansella sp. AB-P1]MDG5789190.1 BsuPI-related putative proteinase inhibitor [Evansella sp. AB-P1]